MITEGLSPLQEASIRDSTARMNIWVGAVRSGKTIASLVRWLTFLSHPECPRGKKLMIGKTMDTLRRNVLEPLGPDIQVRGARAWIFGHQVDLVSAHHQSSEARIRGITAAGAYCDEITTWPENFWVMLLSRLSVHNAKLFGTTNPDSPRHWLKKNYLDRGEALSMKNFHFSLRDNPFLPPGFVDQLEMEYTGLWKKRFIDGLWVMAEGAIWDSYDDQRHLERGAPVHLIRSWASIDYGTGAPFVLLVMGLGEDRRIHVVKEWRWNSTERGRQMADVEYSNEVRKILKGMDTEVEWLYVPPDAASFTNQLYRDGFLRVRNPPSEVSVIDGLREVGNLFSEEWDGLRIHDSCEGLIDEITGYVWDPGQQSWGNDAPLKAEDHGPDALRYGVVGGKWLWRQLIRPRREMLLASA